MRRAHCNQECFYETALNRWILNDLPSRNFSRSSGQQRAITACEELDAIAQTIYNGNITREQCIGRYVDPPCLFSRRSERLCE
jgi:hypothetical protein